VRGQLHPAGRGCLVHQDCVEHPALGQQCLSAHLDTLLTIRVDDCVRASWRTGVKTGYVEQIWGSNGIFNYLVRLHVGDNSSFSERLCPALGFVRLERLP